MRKPKKINKSNEDELLRLAGFGIFLDCEGAFVKKNIKSLKTEQAYEAYIDIDWQGRFMHQGELIDVRISMEREINFTDKYITNIELIISPSKKGIGALVFESQILYAQKAGFSYVEALAYGEPPSTGEQWNGNITWAKFGYLIFEEHTQINFENLLSQERNKYTDSKCPEYLNSKTINDVVLYKEGVKFLKESAFSWVGRFDLKANSKSWEIWNKYRNN